MMQMNTCNGFYCDWFNPNKAYKPTMWSEAWTGWLTEYGGAVPYWPAEDMVFSLARFIQTGSTFINYMIQGWSLCRVSAAKVSLWNIQFSMPPWSIKILLDYSVCEPLHNHVATFEKSLRQPMDSMLTDL